MQCDSILRSGFNQEALITFYAPLSVSPFFDLLKLTRTLASAFGSTYT
jgi:hypothetical protein